MQILHWQFKPGFWPTLAVIILFPFLFSLGMWQLDRADQKQALETQYKLRGNAAPIDLNQADGQIRQNVEQMQWRQVFVRGSFDSDNILILDNQVMSAQAGYFVFVPLSLPDETVKVLVNFGWVPVGPDRSRPPNVVLPETELVLKGVAKKTPVTGIKLAATKAEELGKGYTRLQEIDLAALAKNRNWELLPYVIRLQAPAPDGVLRQWLEPGFGKEKHLGYAFQWFLLASTLLIIYLVLNLKRTK